MIGPDADEIEVLNPDHTDLEQRPAHMPVIAVREASAPAAPVRRARGLGRAVLTLVAAAVLLGGVELVLVLERPPRPTWVAFLVPLTAGAYVAAGALAWLHRRSSDLGAQLVAGGFVWLATGFVDTQVPALVALGAVTATLPVAVVVHLLVGFPSGRLRTHPLRALVGTGYLACTVLQAPLFLFSAFPPPYDLLQVDDRPDLVQLGTWVQSGVGSAVVVCTVALLVRRLQVASPSHRRVLLPLYAYGISSVLFVPLSATVLAPALGWSPVVLSVLQVAVLALVPAAFGCSLLRGGFARAAEPVELGAWLGEHDRGPGALQRALADALGDPSVDIVFRDSDRASDEGVDGHPAALPPSGAGRGRSDVDLAGRRVGAITYDLAAVDDPDLVRRAGRLVAVALDRERLTAELLASQDELRRSRQRIVEAGDRERHRVERNLHDGAQQRLMTAALQLHLAQACLERGEPPAGALRSAALDLDDAMRELRELARGLHPPLLREVGLAGALESLAERSPIFVQLRIRAVEGLAQTTNAGAYYVVAEAMTNSARHSAATRLDILVEVRDDCLCVHVADDGVGGARAAPGGGLEGLADRVDALGGRLRILSPAGGGTTVEADLPCA